MEFRSGMIGQVSEDYCNWQRRLCRSFQTRSNKIFVLLTKKKRKATEDQKNWNCFCILPTENPTTFVPMSSTFKGREEAFLNIPKIALKNFKVKVSIIGCILCLSIEKLCLDIEEDT